MKKFIAVIVLLIVFTGCATHEGPKVIDETRIGKGFNLFSKKSEVELGRSFATEIEKEVKLDSRPYLKKYISDLGFRLIRHYHRKDLVEGYEFEFKVVKSAKINAFATAGGKVYVNTGLIASVENETQLAGVIAHEIGHVIGRHITKILSKKLLMAGIIAGVSEFVIKDEGKKKVFQLLGSAFIFFSSLKFSRDDEREADYIGVHMLYDADYNPYGLTEFFRWLKKQKKGGYLPEFLSTHPDIDERIANTSFYASTLKPKKYRPLNSRIFLKAKKLAGAGSDLHI